jgi:hypothetical protein
MKMYVDLSDFVQGNDPLQAGGGDNQASFSALFLAATARYLSHLCLFMPNHSPSVRKETLQTFAADIHFHHPVHYWPKAPDTASHEPTPFFSLARKTW